MEYHYGHEQLIILISTYFVKPDSSSTLTKNDNHNKDISGKLAFGFVTIEREVSYLAKPVGFEKILKSTAQQFCAAEEYRHVGEGLSTGKISIIPTKLID